MKKSNNENGISHLMLIIILVIAIILGVVANMLLSKKTSENFVNEEVNKVEKIENTNVIEVENNITNKLVNETEVEAKVEE